MAALALVLLFLLTQATGNRELYERNYARLLVLNVVDAKSQAAEVRRALG